jgi:glycosyltransferase involved in cell wall biosynthesis
MGVTTTRTMTTTERPVISTAATARMALAVADANWFTTENLFREVPADRASTLLLKCIDYNNALRSGTPPWTWGRSLTKGEPGHWHRDLVLPTGWMKRFPKWGMRPITRSIHGWHAQHVRDERLVLVMTYPHYLYLRDQVQPHQHVYFNVDDYSQYWPRDADVVNLLERQAVRESDLTVCVSRLRAEELQAAIPEAAHKIRHLPHGAPTAALSSHPLRQPASPPADIAHLPRPLLGYIGTLEDRIDWPLLCRVAEEFPKASLVFVGRLGEGKPSGWRSDRERCLARPNVHTIDWRPQHAIHNYNRSFDVCLIPYRVDHSFNRVCCPTKIMDYMATGRPIVSTALPECRLYQQLFDVVDSPSEFLGAIRRIIASGSDDGRVEPRHAWARDNTCQRVVERLLSWIQT